MHDALVVLTLVLLEGALSVDNSLALAAMVKNLPPTQQSKALMYGVGGAFFFRFLALFVATTILKNPWIRLFGGVYLIYLACSYFVNGSKSDEVKPLSTSNFIKILIMVELTDLSFSIDSIIAASGLSQKLSIVLLGGILGIIMMRFMASIMIKLMGKYGWLEKVAYVVINFVGMKLVYEASQFVIL